MGSVRPVLFLSLLWGVFMGCTPPSPAQESTPGSLALDVTSPSIPRFPPRFSHAYQSATTVSAGQAVTFDVSAVDPQSSTLTFSWSATQGTLDRHSSGPTTSRRVWTAPSCAVASTRPTVTTTVTNAFGLMATQQFEVTGLPACPPSWTSTQPMSSARTLHTATLLPDGKVLVSGGRDFHGSISYLATAEVYDPATGAWSPTGSLSTPREGHTATLLPNGKVLVSGGYNPNGYLKTAEVYDPATGAWSPTGSLSIERDAHTATLLPNGKVLVSGGYSNGGVGLATAEVYDPATGAWSPTGSLSSTRYSHTATLLSNGTVLVSGGLGIPGSTAPLGTAEVYDPATGAWSPTGAMASVRQVHTATLLPNGKVLVSGGYGASVPLKTAEIYDPATGAWSPTGSLSAALFLHTATLLPNGTVLVVGKDADDDTAEPLAIVEVYDPATGTWLQTSAPSGGRAAHTATLLLGGKVLILGGSGGDGFLATAEVYSP